MTFAGVSANNLDKIALSNTTYTYTRHPDWAGGPVTTTPVVSIDVQELKNGGGCSPVSGHIHALFTAYHPYLGTCSVYIQGPGIPPPAGVTPAISTAGQAISPAGGQDFDISTLTPCAYVLWIVASGDGRSGPRQLRNPTTLHQHQGYQVSWDRLIQVAAAEAATAGCRDLDKWIIRAPAATVAGLIGIAGAIMRQLAAEPRGV